MRGPLYEKATGNGEPESYEKQVVDPYEKMKEAARVQHLLQHHRPNFFYHFIGKLVAKIALLFILSFPAAWVGMKATPENIRWGNYYCAKYLQFAVSFLPADKKEPAGK